jgi:hypothetical protein
MASGSGQEETASCLKRTCCKYRAAQAATGSVVALVNDTDGLGQVAADSEPTGRKCSGRRCRGKKPRESDQMPC